MTGAPLPFLPNHREDVRRLAAALWRRDAADVQVAATRLPRGFTRGEEFRAVAAAPETVRGGNYHRAHRDVAHGPSESGALAALRTRLLAEAKSAAADHRAQAASHTARADALDLVLLEIAP